MRASVLRGLRSTVAVGAIALGGGAANATCTTANGVVTCTGPNTTNDVNGAIERTPPPSVTVVISPNATVTRGFIDVISASGVRFNGAIGYTNDGTVGTAGANVNFRYSGDINNTQNPANTFTFDNRGVQNGGIFAMGVGGAISGTNTGTVTGGIDLRGTGPISFNSTGRVSTTSVFGDAITLSSFLTVRTTGSDGTQRSTDVGGRVSAVIDGPVAAPETTTGPVPRAQNILAIGVAGANVTVNGLASTTTVRSRGETTESRSTFSSSGGTSTSTSLFNSSSGGGDARGIVGATGRVGNLFVESGRGTATAIVNGSAENIVTGSGLTLGSVSAVANGVDTTSQSSFVVTSAPAFSNSSTNRQTRTNTGGAASVDIAAGARATGEVSAVSNAGAANVRIAGSAGSAGGSLPPRSVLADSRGINSTSESRSITRPDGSSEGSSTSSETASGGAATLTVASTGRILGRAEARGDVSATLDNAGSIGGNVSVLSDRNGFNTTQSNNSSRTIAIDAAGVRTQVDRQNATDRLVSRGGTARLVNGAGATIAGSAEVSGVRTATFDNLGVVQGSVLLSSSGGDTTSTRSEVITTTRVPATGGGATTTVVDEDVISSNSRSTGGSTVGNYGGVVGIAQAPAFFFRSDVFQSAAATSTATVTGTLFANFTGEAGSENVDGTTTSTDRQVTQPNGALTRESSSTSRQTVTQNASTSSLTIAASGSILSNNVGGGNVALDSAGGDAAFTLNGGRVSGDVGIGAGTGSNGDFTDSSTATFTRAAPTSANPFPIEVQQSETRSNLTEVRQALGAATAIVNGGTIGGDLLVQGTGRGAGGLGANVSVGGTVTGVVTATSFGVDLTERTSSSATRTGPNTVARTTTTSSVQGPSANNGGVLVTVNGTVGGGVLADGGSASATVNLTGQVSVPTPGMATTGTPGGVTVFSFDRTQRFDSEESFISPSFFFNGAITSRRTTTTTTPTGGVATLNVSPTPALQAANRSSIEGDVIVQGFAGSVLNVASGARIAQNTGRVIVGGTTGNTVTTSTGAFTGSGVQTGSTTVTTDRAAGGPATLNNAGTIGSSGNAPGVSVTSVGGASVNNMGTINGTILASAGSFDVATTTTSTALNTPATRRTVTSRTTTPVGGAARVDNAGLVTDGVTVIGATGTATNSGVVRGRVSLGGSFSNFDTTTTTQNSGTGATTTTETTARPTLFNQSYRLDQNGVLLSGVSVAGVTTVDANGVARRTSNVDATVNLNAGSITLGDIVADANSTTNVNLTGAGFLGVAANDVPAAPAAGQRATAFASTPSLTRFAAVDPLLAANVPLPSGSRISGVQTLTKSGPGSFVIVGAPQLPGVGTATPTYTLDVGTVRITGGELQLGLAGTTAAANSFGIRGNVENGADLVVGRRIVNGTQSAVQGINLAVTGNLNNAAAGNLIVGANPGFVRSSPANAFVAFGPNAPAFGSTNSFVRVDGNLTLAGAVAVQGVAGGLYEAGRAYDLFSVGGTYTNTGAVRSNFASPFVSFTLTPRSEGGRTIVSLDVTRRNFDTVATDPNAAAAANALQATLPTVFGALRTGVNAADTQDLAGIIAALDTRFTADQSAQLFRELSSGEFYGSLSAVSTTVPFGEATDGLSPPGGASGVGIWLRPTGQFAKYRRNDDTGADEIDVNNYGGSLGLNFAAGEGVHIGVAGGYGRIEAGDEATVEATADTWMAGIYGAGQFGPLHVSAQAVYGQTEWDATRVLPLLGRTANSSFDSEEIRASLRIAYTLVPLPGLDISPFARLEARRYDFDAFREDGAGAVSLTVAKRTRTVVTPEVGIRMAGALGRTLRPFAEASYIFQEDVGSDRRVAFTGGAIQNFTLNGVDPGDGIKGAIGVVADVAGATMFLRGDYATGGEQQVGSVRGGLLFTF